VSKSSPSELSSKSRRQLVRLQESQQTLTMVVSRSGVAGRSCIAQDKEKYGLRAASALAPGLRRGPRARPPSGQRRQWPPCRGPRRADGGSQVTCNGHPLYFYFLDQKPGNTNGQGVNAFGARWFALTPAGSQIVAPAPSGAGTSSGGGGALEAGPFRGSDGDRPRDGLGHCAITTLP
jgi:hypothetical protein